MRDYRQPDSLPIWNTKLARRIVPIAIGLVSVPIVLTVAILGKVGRDQIASTVDRMAGINRGAMVDAGDEFRKLGRETIQRSSRQTADISAQAVHRFSGREQQMQSDYLRAAAAQSIKVTQASLADATLQSLQTHRLILHQVSGQMGAIVAQSTRDAEQHAVRRIENAMMSQIDAVMQERAEQLAQQVTENIRTHRNYLELTAQMPEFLARDASGQKAILDALVRRYPMFMAVSAIDSSGNETAMSASDRVVTSADLGNRRDTGYFKAGMQDEAFIAVETGTAGSQPDQGRNAPVLRLATPIERYRGRAVGVLTARLSLADAWDIVRSTRIGKTGFAYVVTSSGRSQLSAADQGGLLRQSALIEPLHWQVTIAQPRDEVTRPILALQHDIAASNNAALGRLRGNIRTASEAAVKQMASGAQALQASAETEVDARTKRVFERFRNGASQQTETELQRLQLATREQAATAENDSNLQMDSAVRSAASSMAARVRALTESASRTANHRLSVLAMAIMGCSCGLGMVIAMALSARIVGPVVLLAQGTRAIARGDLDKRVDERAPGEIGDLAVAFNTMAQSLQSSRSELQVAETQLVHSAKLASLGTLSAGVAHELNQPLAIIRGVAQQLRDEKDLTARLRDDLCLIEGQTSRMMKIVKHLRTFSHAGSPELTEIDVSQVIQDCFILIGAQLKAHGIEVELVLADGLPRVLGDANELEQVFLNLISNARDALDACPLAKLTIKTRLEGDSIVADFTDNGTGIPAGIAEHVFDPFFTTKEPGKGTGLGLSISHGIIQRHRGTITLGQAHGQGTSFCITLPRLGAALPQSGADPRLGAALPQPGADPQAEIGMRKAA